MPLTSIRKRPCLPPAATDAPPQPAAVVVLPTFNEAENILQLVPELLALDDGLRVIVVDDRSPDGTGALADRLAMQHPGRVEVIHRAGKLGLGTAYVSGFQRALDQEAGCIITMDADFSHHPRYIPAMLDCLGTSDLVIGSRYVAGGRAVDSPVGRRALSRGANLIAHSVLGLKARDVTAGFRIYRRAVLETVPFGQVFSSGYSFLIELLFQVERHGWRVAEVPIEFRDRTRGQSKISKQEIIKALYTVGRLAFRRMQGR